jgi:hypothetical protein
MVRGTDFSGVNVSGNLAIGTGVNFNAIFNLAGSSVNFNSDFWNSDQQWLVFEGSTPPTGSFTLGTVSNDSFDNAFSLTGGTLSFSTSGNNLYLDFTLSAIPEPSSWIAISALIITGGIIAIRRRSRQAKGIL